MAKTPETAEDEKVDPYLAEQNEGILVAFAQEHHTVLTTPEIEDHVDLSQRQVLRRLNDLEDEEIVGSRKPGRTRLWWLKKEIKEPVSVQYPLLKLVRERVSLQFALLGALMGIVTVIFSTAAMIATGYGISFWMFDPNQFLQSALLSSLLAVLLLITAGSIAGTMWLFDSLGIEIRYGADD